MGEEKAKWILHKYDSLRNVYKKLLQFIFIRISIFTAYRTMYRGFVLDRNRWPRKDCEKDRKSNLTRDQNNLKSGLKSLKLVA